jgi:hypothetical protein
MCSPKARPTDEAPGASVAESELLALDLLAQATEHPRCEPTGAPRRQHQAPAPRGRALTGGTRGKMRPSSHRDQPTRARSTRRASRDGRTRRSGPKGDARRSPGGRPIAAPLRSATGPASAKRIVELSGTSRAGARRPRGGVKEERVGIAVHYGVPSGGRPVIPDSLG